MTAKRAPAPEAEGQEAAPAGASRGKGKPIAKGKDSRRGKGPKKGAKRAGPMPKGVNELLWSMLTKPKVVAYMTAAMAGEYGEGEARHYLGIAFDRVGGPVATEALPVGPQRGGVALMAVTPITETPGQAH